MNAPAASLQRQGNRSGALGVVRDLVALCKPRITVMVIVTALGGMWLASRMAGAAITWPAAVAALIGISLVVSAANVLNMYIERDTDGLMERTRNRPLPAGRMAPNVALAWGLALAAISVPMLFALVNTLTAVLAAVSLILYVCVYTPLKSVSPIALLIGAIPGAAPPLLGWTAASGRVDAGALALFAMLFFWQLPHFLAIATFRQDDYESAGIRVLPAVRGQGATRFQAIVFTVLLVLSSLSLVPLGLTGPVYVINAIVLGALFLFVSWRGLPRRKADAWPAGAPTENIFWARSVFAVSLVYLPLMIAAMMVSA